MYSCLTDDGYVDNKAKRTKNCVIKRVIKFKTTKTVWRIMKKKIVLQQQFKSEPRSEH